MTDRIQPRGRRGESFADVARRTGELGGVAIAPDATDQEVLDAAVGDITDALAEAETALDEKVADAAESAATATAAALRFDDLAGDEHPVRLFDRRYNAANATAYYGVSGAAGTELEAGKPVKGVRTNLRLGASAVSMAIKVYKKLLADGDINSASPESWTEIPTSSRIITAAEIASLGVLTGAPNTTNLGWFDFDFTLPTARETGYALGFLALAYTADDAGGSETTLYAATTATTGDPQYVRGWTQNAAGSWAGRADGAGLSFEFYGDKPYTTSEVATDTADLGRLAGKIDNSFGTTEVILATNAQTGFVNISGGFRSSVVIRATPVGVKLTEYETRVSVNTATSVNLRLTLHRREADDSRINTYPNVTHRRRTPLGSVTLSTASTGLANGVEGPIVWDLSSLDAANVEGGKIEYLVENLDSGGSVIAHGYATGAASAQQHESGWVLSSSGTVTNQSLAFTIRGETFEVSSGGAEDDPADVMVSALGDLSISTLTVTVGGSTLVDPTGTETPFSGSVVFSAAPSGQERYDILCVNVTSGALSAVAGTASAVEAAELQPRVTNGSLIGIATVRVTETAVTHVISIHDREWPVTRGLMARFTAWKRDANRKMRPVHEIAEAGGTVIASGGGDSTISIGSPASAVIPNGAGRDNATGYLDDTLTSGTIAAANIETDPVDGKSNFGPFRRPWRTFQKRYPAATVERYNFGSPGMASGYLTNVSTGPAYVAAIAATNPHVFHLRIGQNNVPNASYSASGLQTDVDSFLKALIDDVATTNLKVVVIHGLARASDNRGEDYSVDRWKQFNAALGRAARGLDGYGGVATIFVNWWPGYDAYAGILGIAGPDLCTANNTIAGNHPGIREMNWESEIVELAFERA